MRWQRALGGSNVDAQQVEEEEEDDAASGTWNALHNPMRRVIAWARDRILQVNSRAHKSLSQLSSSAILEMPSCPTCGANYPSACGAHNRHATACAAVGAQEKARQKQRDENKLDHPQSPPHKKAYQTPEDRASMWEAHRTQDANQGSSGGTINPDSPEPPQPPEPPAQPPAVAAPPSYRIVYHPASMRPPDVLSESSAPPPDDPVYAGPDPPWQPFSCLADFEFADFAARAQLSNAENNELLQKMATSWASNVCITFKNAGHVRDGWTQATDMFPKYEEKKFTMSYQSPTTGETATQEFGTHVMPAMTWIKEVVGDKNLAKDVMWEPMKKYKCEDGRETMFVDEPMSAQDCYDAQDRLPKGATAVHISLYSDATKIARFNNKSFHPVVGRILNVKDTKRNSATGLGGGTLLGYIPKVEAKIKGDKDKPVFVNYKREVFHKALSYILESLEGPAESGHDMECGDAKERCELALTRGPLSNFPCPVCLVPHDEQHDLCGAVYPLRSAAASQAAYEKAQVLLQTPGNIGRAEKNAFWDLGPNSCPHRALSFDVLHFFDGGIWGKHLLVDLLKIIDEAGNSDKLDARHATITSSSSPMSWLHHLTSDHDTEFLTCLGGLLILPVSHDLVPKKYSVIIPLIRALACLRIIAGFSVHTEQRTKSGEAFVVKFGTLLQKFGVARGKKYDFPKAHASKHLFSDIRRKGVTKNYNTKLGEFGHIGYKGAFQQTRKGGEYEAELVEIIGRLSALCRIAVLVAEYYQTVLPQKPEPEDFKFQLGTPQHPVLAHALQRTSFSTNPVFDEFYDSLKSFLVGVALEEKLCPADQTPIVEHKLLRINFTSLDTWQRDGDVLRSNQVAYGVDRADCVMVKVTKGHQFARLHFMFTCQAFGKCWSVARVTFFSHNAKAKSSQVGMERVKETQKGEFILIDTIVRGAWLTPDGDKKNYFFVNDLIDSDAYLRLLETPM
ncbi:hypothetical protein BOTBODRAFT_45772 [Botryobasidium botryosum FD-172 SS1]|uniref:Uncharacterized protein n=1 Tax=Botryobasidium botryosum (strain FD-172 SS1) TaxID=930990 RepID=A0A067MD83_BOTB1|nr:hypothetical protein BOTBODRAFT_45772 [Botryobasidium botryosum FD-172 SS1]